MMNQSNSIRIVGILDNFNMCGWHGLRLSKQAKALKRGQCIVAFNRKLTIGRIVDSAGGVHTWYAPPKEIFDLDSLSRLIDDGFWVQLTLGAAARKKASDLKLVA